MRELFIMKMFLFCDIFFDILMYTYLLYDRRRRRRRHIYMKIAIIFHYSTPYTRLDGLLGIV